MELEDPDVHKEMDQYVSRRSSLPGGGQAGTNQPGTSRPPAYVPPETAPYQPPSESMNSGGGQTDLSPGSSRGSNQNGNNDGTDTINTPDSGFGEGTDEEMVAVNTPNNGESGGGSVSPGFSSRFRNKSNGVPPGFCPNCRMELPQGVGPGEHCPRCNVFLEEWVTPGTGPPVDPWYVRYPVIYIVGGLIVAIGALSLLSKKFYG